MGLHTLVVRHSDSLLSYEWRLLSHFYRVVEKVCGLTMRCREPRRVGTRKRRSRDCGIAIDASRGPGLPQCRIGSLGISATMLPHSAIVLFHNANTDVLQLSCRRYPSGALEGDRISGLFDAICLVAAECKRLQNQEGYDEAYTSRTQPDATKRNSPVQVHDS